MYFFKITIVTLLLLTSTSARAQTIDSAELFNELHAIKNDQTCHALNAKKLFYFRTGPKTRSGYSVEKQIISAIHLMFPDQAYFDVSGIGLLASLDQGNSNAYIDMINASLEAINQPGMYFHADFRNLESADLLELTAWSLSEIGTELGNSCLKRIILFRDSSDSTASNSSNFGINIGGDITQGGSGQINIINNNSFFSSE